MTALGLRASKYAGEKAKIMGLILLPLASPGAAAKVCRVATFLSNHLHPSQDPADSTLIFDFTAASRQKVKDCIGFRTVIDSP